MTTKYHIDTCYWDGTGKYQVQRNLYWSELVPTIGPTGTIEGELLRAAGKIYHDLYNNGFGNNWTGAFRLLETSDVPNIDQALHLISNYQYGRMIHNDHDEAERWACEVIMDQVLEYIIAQPTIRKSDVDMLTLTSHNDRLSYWEDEEYGEDEGDPLWEDDE